LLYFFHADKLLLKAALVCLLHLLPTAGKHRVSNTAARQYVLEEIMEAIASVLKEMTSFSVQLPA
jgi:hypothetical protein